MGHRNSGTAEQLFLLLRLCVCVLYRVYVHTNFRILLFRCSSCSINGGVLYVYTTLDDKNYVNQQLKQLVSTTFQSTQKIKDFSGTPQDQRCPRQEKNYT